MKPLVATFLFFLTSFPSLAQDSNPTTLPTNLCNLSSNESIVPNILGFLPTDAKKIIENCGFTYDGAEDVHTLSYEAIGTVGDQQPSGGTVGKKGSTVRGFVSVGLYPPNFVGWKLEDAERFYRDFRHGVDPRLQRNPAEVGTVFAQVPANAELANSGPALILYVSEGLYIDLEQHLSSLVGKDYFDAKNYLTGIRLIAAHGAGFYEWKSRQITNCEWEFTYPRVTAVRQSGRVYEGDTIVMDTEEWSRYEIFPKGSDGKDCD